MEFLKDLKALMEKHNAEFDIRADYSDAEIEIDFEVDSDTVLTLMTSLVRPEDIIIETKGELK